MTASRQVRRPRRTALLLTVLAGVLLLGAAPAALAHDGLVGTTPAAGTTVPAPPATVEVAFTGAPLPLGTLVEVTDAAGAVVSAGDPEIRGTTVVQALAAELPAGGYHVRWRSTSSDGHALTGSFDFAVAAPSTPAAEPPAPAAPAPEPVAPSPAAAVQDVGPASSGAPVAGIWVAVGAVAVVGLGVLLVGRQRGRR
ncbi:copper resistance CopC family protein [Blastococcus sp. KM273129]|uniref:copper resistance CopC family protein n=1 Tax=Blastococcus sp. KM273129 TaxID=2570315 RepID=UPI001F28D589|nr:copper resistance CopC family protein [Blastococcus sp. KM273129]MCF6734194.1 copper resistance protein CopC [Blastococcus sp. KM273129]